MDKALVGAHSDTMKFHSDELKKELDKGAVEGLGPNPDVVKVHSAAIAASAVAIGIHVDATTPKPDSSVVLLGGGTKNEKDEKPAPKPVEPTKPVTSAVAVPAATKSSSWLRILEIAAGVGLAAIGVIFYAHQHGLL